MAAIVEYESGWKPWSIDDDTTGRSYFFKTQPQAVAAEENLLSAGHNLDVGLAQVNSSNFAEYGLSAETAFDQCTNLRAGAAIIGNDYSTAYHTNWLSHPIKTARDVYLQQQYALIHALSAYNSGREWASMGYAHSVYALGLNVTEIAQVLVPQAHYPVVQIFHPIKKGRQ